MEDTFDVVVVGGGHAGCEAALAAARMGSSTLLISMNISTIAQMSCNPAIGGSAKGQLVREIDALGGEMGLVTDETGIQFRMLNRSKGPAVWAPRAQVDRVEYAICMRQRLERQKNLFLFQGMVTRILVEGTTVVGVMTDVGIRFGARSVILTCGTFLNGLIHVGLNQYPAGRAGEFPSVGLTECLVGLGFESARLKTGTPPRVDGRTIQFSGLEEQKGDDPPSPFSFRTQSVSCEQMPVFITYTNVETHRILASGLDRSPLYTGKIVGTGPRYCPSIEDKIVRFKDKDRHQIFVEPEGRRSNEYYVNGFATSMPEDIQIKSLHTIPGLEKAAITRLGYAIEYDFFPPTQLSATLETKIIKRLFFAGQINGTSGYEEAAAQGLMAGINAVLNLREKQPFILDRSQAYIGVLVDDLVTKGTLEPYRLFTSRAEYRLMLRQDNADLRLTRLGNKIGLISEEQNRIVRQKEERIKKAFFALEKIKPDPEKVNPVLIAAGTAPIQERQSVSRLLKRPEIHLEMFKGIEEIDHLMQEFDSMVFGVIEQLEIEIKYEGYFLRQREQVERFRRLENKKIPSALDYRKIGSLSMEAREKLTRIKPRSLGQAARISGVSPSDISVLSILLARNDVEEMHGDDQSH